MTQQSATVSGERTTKSKGIVWGAAAISLAAAIVFIAWICTRPIQGIPPGWSVLRGDPAQWNWSRGRIHAHTTTGDSILASSDRYGNLTLSAVVATTNREASIAIRLRDENNGYFVTFVPAGTPWPWNGGGFLRLLKRDAGKETTLAEYKGMKGTQARMSAKMKVIARGPTIEVRLNGVKVLQALDTTFSGGRIGFRIYGWKDYPCDATFSNVRFHR